MLENTTVTWRKQSDGQIFHKEKNAPQMLLMYQRADKVNVECLRQWKRNKHRISFITKMSVGNNVGYSLSPVDYVYIILQQLLHIYLRTCNCIFYFKKPPDIFCSFKRIRVKTFAKYACLLARNEGIITDRTAPCYSFNDSDDKIIKQSIIPV